MKETLEEDRISELPDPILLHILSFLPSTRYAIKTGILSKRWQYLWTSVPILVFDQNDFILAHFVQFVDKTLVQCRHNKLVRFEIRTKYYNSDWQSSFITWIHYAVLCNVEELVISMSDDYYQNFELPEFLFKNSCLTKLRLDQCYWNPVGAINWKNLKTLYIGSKQMEQNADIRTILSGSPVLETLELCCHSSGQLDINSTSLRKFVLLVYDGGWSFGSLPNIVTIHAPNMLSLTIDGNLLSCKLVLLDVPSLVVADLECPKCNSIFETNGEEEEEMLKGIILSLQHVKELKLGGRCSEVLSHLRAKGFTCPSNVQAADIFKTEMLESVEWTNWATSSKTVLWHGHNVSESHVELLRAVEEQHPETFQHLRVHAEKVWEAYLGEFGRVITSFMKTSISDLTEDMVRALREDLQDLDMYGFDVSWVFERLHKVEELRFGEPLQQVNENLLSLDKQIALLGEELSHARDKRAELVKERDKKASEVDMRLGMDYNKLPDGSLGFGLLEGYEVPL